MSNETVGKLLAVGLVLLVVLVIWSFMLNLSTYDGGSTNNNEFDWNDSEDVGNYIKWSDDQRENN